MKTLLILTALLFGGCLQNGADGINGVNGKDGTSRKVYEGKIQKVPGYSPYYTDTIPNLLSCASVGVLLKSKTTGQYIPLVDTSYSYLPSGNVLSDSSAIRFKPRIAEYGFAVDTSVYYRIITAGCE